ncbi:MAG TPA: hypothetical protein QF924_15825, partial [Pseudomonadales bacterium]|nr:hypothetical protein [Pseudomonadales bacterium]
LQLPRIDGFSKSRSRWPLGATRREWLVLSKSRNNVDDGFSACPKGAYQMIQYCVTTLEKD